MSVPNYRVVLSFDGERKVFSARAPELEHCAGEGATRGEAIAKLEKEIEAQLQNMQERGHRPPGAIDEIVYSGEITAKVSRSLHRDLAWLARQEGIELEQLLSELLATGLDSRRPASRGSRGPRSFSGSQGQGESHENAGNQRDHRDGPRGGGYGSRYHGILDDRANFIEYVRGLEKDTESPGRGGPGRPGGGPRPDRNDRGVGGGDNRGPSGRRRRGGRPGGPNGPGVPGAQQQQRGGPGGGAQTQPQSHDDRRAEGGTASAAAPVGAGAGSPGGSAGGTGDFGNNDT